MGDRKMGDRKMGHRAAMRPHYAMARDIGPDRLSSGETIVGVIGFDAPRPTNLADAAPFAELNMPLLAAGPPYEVWTSSQPVIRHDAHGIRAAKSGGMLFGLLTTGSADDIDMAWFAEDAYRRIFNLAGEMGCPHVLRVFNYLPRITEIEQGSERYRRFNAGRHQAFVAHGRPADAAPAACALGTQGGNPVVYFIASREPGRPLENPRQVSAYHYPARYGQYRPSFSRAMIVGHPPDTSLFISGTASIVGHESMHPGDPSAQTDEILQNIDALLAQYSRLDTELQLKVYIRHARDVAAVKRRLETLPHVGSVLFLHADICRPDLLVEIEAFVT